MSKEIFEKFRTKYFKERQEIQEQLDNCTSTISNVQEAIKKVVAFSSKLNTVWASGGISVKEKLQKLVYPDGIAFDRENGSFRTAKMNFIFSLIDYDHSKPYCNNCYSVWAQYGNPDYLENVCHRCGEYEESTIDKPQCYACYTEWQIELKQ